MQRKPCAVQKMEIKMKKMLAPVLASAVALSAAAAHAGGPIIIVDEPEVVAQKPASSVGILPLILIGIVLCVALCGGSDDEDPETTPPV